MQSGTGTNIDVHSNRIKKTQIEVLIMELNKRQNTYIGEKTASSRNAAEENGYLFALQ